METEDGSGLKVLVADVLWVDLEGHVADPLQTMQQMLREVHRTVGADGTLSQHCISHQRQSSSSWNCRPSFVRRVDCQLIRVLRKLLFRLSPLSLVSRCFMVSKVKEMKKEEKETSRVGRTMGAMVGAG